MKRFFVLCLLICIVLGQVSLPMVGSDEHIGALHTGISTAGAADEIVLEVYNAAGLTPAVPVKQFTLAELEAIAIAEGSKIYNYSAYNTYGTFSEYLENEGPTITGILTQAFGVSTLDQCLSNDWNIQTKAFDGYLATISKEQLTQTRFYYPSASGIVQGSPPNIMQLSGAVAVAPMLSWASNGRFFMGQLGPSEQHTLILNRNMIPTSVMQNPGQIIVHSSPTEQVAENIITQNNITMFNPGTSFHLADAASPSEMLNLAGTKVYYTLDGTTPTVKDSALYNYNTNMSPALNKEITAPTTVGSYQLRLLLYRYGATNQYKTIPIYVATGTIQVTVTFNTQGGSPVASKEVILGQAIGDLVTPTRAGFTFKGWYDAASDGTKVTS
ncbi:MAG: InlB B-repeat-containing protein, partial [Actinomycetia bacterium]|nr:InlB B-repeat-containing protein [Actinomycetes bacterium]